jgi:hypothetical protein
MRVDFFILTMLNQPEIVERIVYGIRFSLFLRSHSYYYIITWLPFRTKATVEHLTLHQGFGTGCTDFRWWLIVIDFM